MKEENFLSRDEVKRLKDFVLDEGDTTTYEVLSIMLEEGKTVKEAYEIVNERSNFLEIKDVKLVGMYRDHYIFESDGKYWAEKFQGRTERMSCVEAVKKRLDARFVTND